MVGVYLRPGGSVGAGVGFAADGCSSHTGVCKNSNWSMATKLWAFWSLCEVITICKIKKSENCFWGG